MWKYYIDCVARYTNLRTLELSIFFGKLDAFFDG